MTGHCCVCEANRHQHPGKVACTHPLEDLRLCAEHKPAVDPTDLNVPFEEAPPGQTLDASDMALCEGLVVLSAVAPSTLGPIPGIIFRFLDAHTHEFRQGVLLAGSPTVLRDAAGMLHRAAEAAIKQAGR